MKIIFDDESFLEIIGNGDIIRIILCGHKDKNQFTISATDLTKEQAVGVVNAINDIIVNGK